MKLFGLFIVSLVVFALVFSAPLAFAQVGTGGPTVGTGSGGCGEGLLPNPLGGETCTIPELLERIVGFLVLIASPIAAGMIIYGAFQILFAAGDPEKFKIGKRTILYTIVAYAIIFIGWGIVSIIEDVLGGGGL
ncbi:MAG: pilin [Patescibacteria group bacterium]|nr:pilin [Patescibacteria group bacterium]